MNLKNHVCLLAAACVGLNSAPASAQHKPASYEPSSPWSLDYAENSCALTRIFGDPGERTWLEMRSFGPSEFLQITIVNEKYIRHRGKLTFPQSAFMPNGEPVSYRFTSFRNTDEGNRGVIYYLALANPQHFTDERGIVDYTAFHAANVARRTEVDSLIVNYAYERNLLLQTGPLAQPLDALDTCIADLMPHLGSAPLEEIAVQPQLNNAAAWAVELPLPPATRYAKLRGRVAARLLIGTKGEVLSCMVQEPAVVAEYEANLCGLTEREGRFTPARNADGEPVPAFYTLKIEFQTVSKDK